MTSGMKGIFSRKLSLPCAAARLLGEPASRGREGIGEVDDGGEIFDFGGGCKCIPKNN